jgi:hypothetical protein
MAGPTPSPAESLAVVILGSALLLLALPVAGTVPQKPCLRFICVLFTSLDSDTYLIVHAGIKTRPPGAWHRTDLPATDIAV